jgi:predicted SAM-dependent methyltransferase
MKLHLACGKRNFEGWTNVDIVDLPHIHYQTSVEDLSMLSDESADIVYSSHTLEYFDRTEVISVLNEWKRVLKPGGLLRIAVPNFEALLSVYNKTRDISKILGPLYGRMEFTTKNGIEKIYHKTVYDYQSLHDLLTQTGFQNIEVYDWRETEHAQYDDHSQAYYPHMDKENGLLISLNLQAKKC